MKAVKCWLPMPKVTALKQLQTISLECILTVQQLLYKCHKSRDINLCLWSDQIVHIGDEIVQQFRSEFAVLYPQCMEF